VRKPAQKDKVFTQWLKNDLGKKNAEKEKARLPFCMYPIGITLPYGHEAMKSGAIVFVEVHLP